MIDPQRRRLYRLMRTIGLALLLLSCVAGVAFAMVEVALGVAVGLVGALLSLYLIFGFSHVNEKLRRRSSI